ncbi:MAG: DUF3426 domain-containing protein [Bryobacteraceae bacterium]|nr:DUF3426 domain-containing protein [Bryobacteraceae bacterium]
MASKAESKPLISTPVLIVAVLMLLVSGGLWFVTRGGQTAQGPALTAEAKAYVRNLNLADVGMSATLNAVSQQVVEITGKITNKGDQHLKSVSVNCVFYDAYGQIVLRERVEIVRSRTGGLKPGETKPFRLPFDTLPESWNQGPPQLVIAGIVFG